MLSESGDGEPTGAARAFGQVALVTGGGRGIGRAIALRLGAEGARVAVAARTQLEVEETATSIEHAGGTAMALALDVSDRRAVVDGVADVERQLGSVDLLVNDAAVVAPFGLSWEVDPDLWWRCAEINLLGSFLCAHAVMPGMTSRGHGRIVNLASGAGLEAIPHGSAYVTSKAAVIRLSESLAVEAEPFGVSVFAIDPGWVSTAMTDYVARSPQGRRWMPWAESVYGTEAHVSPDRAAELVALLASGRADRLTGRFLRVSDDIEDLIGRSDYVRTHDLHSMRLREE